MGRLETSHGIVETPHGIAIPSHGSAEASHGSAKTPHRAAAQRPVRPETAHSRSVRSPAIDRCRPPAPDTRATTPPHGGWTPLGPILWTHTSRGCAALTRGYRVVRPLRGRQPHHQLAAGQPTAKRGETCGPAVQQTPKRREICGSAVRQASKRRKSCGSAVWPATKRRKSCGSAVRPATKREEACRPAVWQTPKRREACGPIGAELICNRG